jgi:hypothetical protein
VPRGPPGRAHRPRMIAMGKAVKRRAVWIAAALRDPLPGTPPGSS